MLRVTVVSGAETWWIWGLLCSMPLHTWISSWLSYQGWPLFSPHTCIPQQSSMRLGVNLKLLAIPCNLTIVKIAGLHWKTYTAMHIYCKVAVWDIQNTPLWFGRNIKYKLYSIYNEMLTMHKQAKINICQTFLQTRLLVHLSHAVFMPTKTGTSDLRFVPFVPTYWVKYGIISLGYTTVRETHGYHKARQ